jgi:predicted HTH domain antitoxin
MDSLQVRIKERDKEELDELARMLGTSRSEILRRVIDDGLKNTRMKIATEKVLEREFSLSKAAEFSGVSIHRMAEYLASRRIPYFRQSVRDAEEDARTAKKWIQGA